MIEGRRFGRRHDGRESFMGETFVLYYLEKQGSAVPGEISDAMGISSARMAAALNGLDDKGYITREIDKEDRRKIIVNLTAAGKQRAHQLIKEHMSHISEMLEMLGEADAREYVRIMVKIAQIKEHTYKRGSDE